MANKEATVAELKELFSSSTAVLLTEYRGLTVAQLKQLRTNLRADASYAVVKNTLTKIAANEAGIDSLDDMLAGPSALAFVHGDPVTVAKALRDFAKANPNLVVKGGVLGTKALSADEAKALADVEPREVLLAKLAGAMAAPMVQFAGLLQAVPRSFAYGLAALIDQQGGVPDAPAEAPAEPEAAAEAPAAPEADVEAEAPTDADTPTEEAPSEEPAAEAETTTDEAPAAEAEPTTEES